MKKLLFCLTAILLFFHATRAQGLKNLVKKNIKKDSSVIVTRSIFTKVSGVSTNNLSNDEVIKGLKEALQVGTERGAQKLSAVDGFFKDAVIKILMPEEAKKVEKKLRNLGMGKQVDNAILSMNRGAEDAAKSAAPIFINAIKQMNFQDAMSILKGGDSAATKYLREKTIAALTEAFRPVIENSLAKVDATKHWNTVFTAYNKFSNEKVNTDLTAYVTDKALAGIFYQVAQEEMKIRKDPLARTTDILRKVFGN
jgi:uncharacterized protein DUF4197